MNVLVTGSDGFIGGHLCKILVEDGHSVVMIDKKTGNDVLTCNLPYNIERVFHLAAQTDARCNDALQDARDNVMTAVRVFQRYGKKVTFASSSAVNYPTSPYAISKLACEHYAKIFGCGVVRFCNIYGAGGRSFMDLYQNMDFVNAYLPGDQIRTYASVDEACEALLYCKAGQLNIMKGEDLTVREIVEKKYAGKRINWLDPKQFDVIEGRQVYGL